MKNRNSDARIRWLLAFAICAGASTTHATTRPVTDCSDGGGAGTLRNVVASAVSGDTVSLTGLACSAIVLGGTQITVPVEDLTIAGPGRDVFAIDAATLSRVFNHTGPGTLTISGLTLRNGRALPGSDFPRGGCIQSAASVSLDRARVTGCAVEQAAATSGGAIYTAGVLTLTRSELSDNHVVKQGAAGMFPFAKGGAAHVHVLQMFDSSIHDNSVVDSDGIGQGGGAYVELGVFPRDSTIDNNSADYGGGFSVVGGSASVVTNNTISGNTASKAGGGVYLGGGGGTFNVFASTIAFNAAGADGGGGIYGNASDAMTLDNAIVANNTATTIANADVDGVGHETSTFFVFSDASDIVMHTQVPSVINVITLDPQLGPLADNGGFTLTHLPANGSPAIGAGVNDLSLACDQRHFPRRLGAGSDIGSVETQGDRIFSNGFDACHQ
jgi:hypothetical protein